MCIYPSNDYTDNDNLNNQPNPDDEKQPPKEEKNSDEELEPSDTDLEADREDGWAKFGVII